MQHSCTMKEKKNESMMQQRYCYKLQIEQRCNKKTHDKEKRSISYEIRDALKGSGTTMKSSQQNSIIM